MRFKRQRGAQAVEFALVLPLLVLIIFAVIDFFLLAYNKAVITNASREAARRAIILTTADWSEPTVRQVACNHLRNALVSIGTTPIASDCGGATDPRIEVEPATAPGFSDTVSVTVRYTVQGFTLGSLWNLGNQDNSVGAPVEVSATTRMSHE